MNLESYKTQLQSKVIIPFLEYVNKDEDCGYTKKDIKKCETLLLKYLTALNNIKNPSDIKIMKRVKSLVLALNKLNEKTDYCLIETEEREEIWEIIQNSAVACGLTNPEDDITGEWREW